jgi:hypothetical protein
VAQPSTKKKQSMAPTCQMKIKRQGTAAATSHTNTNHTNHILENIFKKEQKRTRQENNRETHHGTLILAESFGLMARWVHRQATINCYVRFYAKLKLGSGTSRATRLMARGTKRRHVVM